MTLALHVGGNGRRALPAVAACQSARVAISHFCALCRFLDFFQGRYVDGVSGASAPLPALHYQVNTLNAATPKSLPFVWRPPPLRPPNLHAHSPRRPAIPSSVKPLSFRRFIAFPSKIDRQRWSGMIWGFWSVSEPRSFLGVSICYVSSTFGYFIIAT